MEKFTAKIQVEYPNGNAYFSMGEDIPVKVTITPLEDVVVEEVDLRFIIETRGKLGVDEIELKVEYLLDFSSLEANKTYTFEKTFVNTFHPSYQGKHFSFLPTVELRIKEHKTETSSNPFKRWFVKDKDFTSTSYVNCNQEEKNLLINNEDFELELNNSWLKYVVGIFLFCAAILFFGKQEIKALPIIIPALGIILLIIGAYFLLAKQLVGKIDLQVRNIGEGLFEAKVSNSKKWLNVNELEVFYQVSEKVIDRRGTSSTTYEDIVYRSEPQTFDNFFQPVKAVLKLNPHFPITFKKGDVEVYWEIVAIVKTRYALSFRFYKAVSVGVKDSTPIQAL
jgi:hypothetical protein